MLFDSQLPDLYFGHECTREWMCEKDRDKMVLVLSVQ